MPADYRLRFEEGKILAIMESASAEALERPLEWLLSQAQDLVPLDKGPLLESGRVVIANNEAGAVVFGDEETEDYAVVQHENLDYQHAPGRQAKYLEEPFLRGIDTMLGMMAWAYRRRFR
jgi:hypothetical protein